MVFFFVFFFQAEDGIRDDLVTGVQTCALPIFQGACRDGSAGVVRTLANMWEAICWSVWEGAQNVGKRRDANSPNIWVRCAARPLRLPGARGLGRVAHISPLTTTTTSISILVQQ